MTGRVRSGPLRRGSGLWRASFAAAIFAGAIAAGADEPATPAARAPEPANQRLVVGHQMLVLPRGGHGASVASMREEIRQWQELGLDATLLFDIGGDDENGQRVRNNARRYHEAGTAEGYHFAISTGYFEPADIPAYADFIASLGKPKWRDARLIVDGRVYLSAYHAPECFGALVAALRDQHAVEVFAEPFVYARNFVFGPGTRSWHTGAITTDISPRNYEVLMDHPAWRDMDGYAAFEIADSIDLQCDRTRWLWEAARARGKTARASVVAYYKGLAHKGNPMVFDGWGYTRLQRSWRAAIDAGVPHVELITLNDVSESTYLNSWRQDDPPILLDHWLSSDNPALLDHSGFRHFSRRYVQWFKTGVEPPITADEFFYAYRLHPRNAADFGALSEDEQKSLRRWIVPGQPAARIYRRGPAKDGPNASGGLAWKRFSDAIHVAVRLTAPADLYIDGQKIATLPAGEHLAEKPGAISEGGEVFGVPAHTFGPADFGFPRFELRRDGRTIFAHRGELEITPYSVPGCWNIFARRAPDSAWRAAGAAPDAVSAPPSAGSAPAAP